jgi:hypothetical protein
MHEFDQFLIVSSWHPSQQNDSGCLPNAGMFEQLRVQRKWLQTFVAALDLELFCAVLTRFKNHNQHGSSLSAVGAPSNHHNPDHNHSHIIT